MTINRVLNFWFGRPNEEDYGQSRKEWFIKNEAFDRQVEEQLFDLYQQAANDRLGTWQNTPEGCLALLILLDQVPRNLFRGQPQAFATDEKASAIAHFALQQGYDRQLLPVQRWFIYLPLEHSEDLEDQKRSVELFQQLPDDPENQKTLNYAIKHRDVIARFGRFPHRNAILERDSTPAEKEFLQQPGSSF